MKKFETPEIEVTTFAVEDIITESDLETSVTQNCTPVFNPF